MKLRIGAGSLTQRVSFQQRTQAKDTEGGMADTWTDVATVWAQKNNLSGNVKTATGAGGEVREARVEFTVRYQAVLDNDLLRIMHNNRIYRITHCNNFMQGNEWLVFTCDTGATSGR